MVSTQRTISHGAAVRVASHEVARSLQSGPEDRASQK